MEEYAIRWNTYGKRWMEDGWMMDG